MSCKIEAAKKEINEIHPGRIFLSLAEACALAGISLKTVRNQAVTGDTPFPTAKLGGRRVVPVLALAEVLAAAMPRDDLSPAPQQITPTEPAKRPRGRPRKLVAAQQEGGAV